MTNKMNLIVGIKDNKLNIYKPITGIEEIDNLTKEENKTRYDKIWSIKKEIDEWELELDGCINEFGNGIGEIDIIQAISNLQSKLSQLTLIVVERD